MGWNKFLEKSEKYVQVISPRNYFAFTPLLPSVTCGTVEARSIVEPIRNIVRKVIIKELYYIHTNEFSAALKLVLLSLYLWAFKSEVADLSTFFFVSINRKM